MSYISIIKQAAEVEIDMRWEKKLALYIRDAIRDNGGDAKVVQRSIPVVMD